MFDVHCKLCKSFHSKDKCLKGEAQISLAKILGIKCINVHWWRFMLNEIHECFIHDKANILCCRYCSKHLFQRGIIVQKTFKIEQARPLSINTFGSKRYWDINANGMFKMISKFKRQTKSQKYLTTREAKHDTLAHKFLQIKSQLSYRTKNRPSTMTKSNRSSNILLFRSGRLWVR